MTAQSPARILVDPASVPVWLGSLLEGISGSSLDEITKWQPPAGTAPREAAVLVLFGETHDGPDVLIIERAADMRSHAGQPAFPGGACEPQDSDIAATALREANEEANLDSAGVTIVAELPAMWLPPSGFMVTPVIGWWHLPSEIWAGDPTETAAVHRVSIADMIDPANRVLVSHPIGYIGPGFMVSDMLVWGFTAMLLDRLFAMAGWEKPWSEGARTVPFDSGYSSSAGDADAAVASEVPE